MLLFEAAHALQNLEFIWFFFSSNFRIVYNILHAKIGSFRSRCCGIISIDALRLRMVENLCCMFRVYSEPAHWLWLWLYQYISYSNRSDPLSSSSFYDCIHWIAICWCTRTQSAIFASSAREREEKWEKDESILLDMHVCIFYTEYFSVKLGGTLNAIQTNLI